LCGFFIAKYCISEDAQQKNEWVCTRSIKKHHCRWLQPTVIINQNSLALAKIVRRQMAGDSAKAVKIHAAIPLAEANGNEFCRTNLVLKNK